MSLCGAPWLQPVAIVGKPTRLANHENKRKPLPSVATGWATRASGEDDNVTEIDSEARGHTVPRANFSGGKLRGRRHLCSFCLT
jgi:hypothetical protein